MSESTLPGRTTTGEVESDAMWRLILQRAGALLTARSMVPVWLVAIVLVASVFRFTGLDWGQGTFRHPDERHLAWVTADVKWPSSFSAYLDEQNSPLNPRNLPKGWVYGDFPLTMVKWVALQLNELTSPDIPWDSMGQVYLVGRALSGLFDLGTLLVLFLIARRLYKDYRVALLAAFLFGITVLPIQHSHFYVVDNYVTFFVMVTLYWLVRIFQSEGPGYSLDYMMAGLFFGASLATKASVFTLAAVFGVVGGYRLFMAWREQDASPQVRLEQVVLRMSLAVLVTLVAFRILQPYTFTGPGLLDIGISERWVESMKNVRAQVTGEADPPWGFQWANRTAILFPLRNMVQWGMGIPLGLAAWAGFGTALWQVVRRQRWVHLIPVTWIAVLFLHQGTQWVKSLRYFLPIYPMLIMLAAWLLLRLWDRGREPVRVVKWGGLLAWTRAKAGLLMAVVVVGTFLYALAFMNIYTTPHTHIQASRWAYKNIPDGAVVATEHFDEGFPVHLQGINPQNKTFYGLSHPKTGNRDWQLQWYNPDTPKKLEAALDWFDEADYIVTVSNRLYGSTARLPARFPMTVNYYNALFSGDLGFERVADFTSGPRLFGIELNDQFHAEEAFSVYDHPRVQIFKKTDAYDRERARALLSEGVDWSNISHLTAKEWTERGGRSETLKFAPADWTLYEQSGSWSQIFDRGGLRNRFPLLPWILMVQALGLLALPYMATVARGLPDRGYAFAKTLGLLLVSWLIWLLASWRVVTFSAWGIFLAMGVVGVGAALLARWAARKRTLSLPDLLRRWWARDRRIFLLTEALFWGFFLLVLAVRWANPDIWHPDLGGERPMDLAYLNAIIKSPYFPPMDPWFAGGYINYYYFGFVLVATLIKFTGVIPAIAYNLAVPTLFAMLATGTWGAALALLVPLRGRLEGGDTGGEARIPRKAITFATLAAVLVAVAGNLAQLKVFADLSNLPFQSGLPGVDFLVRSIDGLVRGTGMVLQGETLPGRLEWPYWNATRVIPDTINEFPWFTFLYADLHAHMMALPYTVLAIGLALAFLRAPLAQGRFAEGLRLVLLALVIGSLWPMNTWDFPTYALVAFAGLGLYEWRRAGAITPWGVLRVAWRWGLLLLLGRLLFHPFHAHFGSAYTSFRWWEGDRSQLSDFLFIHGLFLFAITFAMASDFLFGRGHNGALRILRFNLRTIGRRQRAGRLFKRLVQPPPVVQLLSYVSVMLCGIAFFLVLAQWTLLAFTLFLLAAALLLFFRAVPSPRWQMALFFIILGLGLAMAVELVVLEGDIGRMNTVFKFYLQIWVLWGIAAAVGVARVSATLPRWSAEWRMIWRTGLAILFATTMLYPIFATHAKINDRFDRSVGPTLNGAAFMEKAVYHKEAEPFALKWDAAAIRWMQEKVPGSPTVVEMNTEPDLYRWGNRYAMWTGNPSLIGWSHHQRQQRAAAGAGEIGQRINDLRTLYNTPDGQAAHDIMLRYGVDYFVVGPLERIYASPDGIGKFAQERGRLWDLVYENPEVKIYRVTR